MGQHCWSAQQEAILVPEGGPAPRSRLSTRDRCAGPLRPFAPGGRAVRRYRHNSGGGPFQSTKFEDLLHRASARKAPRRPNGILAMKNSTYAVFEMCASCKLSVRAKTQQSSSKELAEIT